MNTKSILTFLGLAGGAILMTKLYRVKEAINELRYRMVGLKVDKKSIHLTTCKGLLLVAVDNPNLEPLPLRSFKGDMIYRGTPVSNLVLLNRGEVLKPQSTTNVEIEFTIDNISTGIAIVDTLIKLFNKDKVDDKEIDRNVSVRGWLQAGSMSLKINTKFQLV